MTRSLELLALIAITTLSACAPSYSSCEERMGPENARLEGGLRAIQGIPRAYEASNAQGTLRVDLTVDSVDEGTTADVAQAPLGVRLAALLSDAFVPPAYADEEVCEDPSAPGTATYVITWSPSDGEAVVLHEGQLQQFTYTLIRLPGVPADEAETELAFFTEDGARVGLVASDGEVSSLALDSYDDTGHPEANITPQPR